MARLNDVGIIMLARTASTHIAHLRTPVFLIHLCLKVQNSPISLTVFQTRNVSVDIVDGRNLIAHVAPTLTRPSRYPVLRSLRLASPAMVEQRHPTDPSTRGCVARPWVDAWIHL